MIKYLQILTLVLFSSIALSQNTIQGTVHLKGTEKPISNAYVFLENSSYGTVASPKGHWNLNVPKGTYMLVISADGMITYKSPLEINSDLNLELELEEDLQTLPELVVESYTLSLGRQGLREIPGSVDYLGPQELKAFQYSNVNEVLKSVPGVNIQEEEGFGLRPNIGMRGSGVERSSKITVMEDGILAAPAPYAAPSAYYFPTIGRMNGVEVLKGSSQVRFGPFTTGGAINFISTPIPNQFAGNVAISAGNFGFRSVNSNIGNSYKNVGFLVETFQYGADGFKNLPNGDNTGFIKRDYQAKLRFNTNKEARNYQSLTFMVGQTTEDSNETYLGLTDEDFNVDPYQRYAASQIDNMIAEQSRFSLQHYIEIPGIFNIVTTAYRNDFRRNWYKLQSLEGQSSVNSVLTDPNSNDLAYNILTGDIDIDTAVINVRANNRKYYSQGIQTVFDIEFKTAEIEHDIHISSRYHQDQEARFQHENGYSILGGIMQLEDQGAPGSHANRIETATAWANYIFYKVSYRNWILTPGMRHENIIIDREDYGRNDPGRLGTDLSSRQNQMSVFLPGVGVSYQLNNRMILFGGIHKGFAPAGSSVDTDTEESTNYEVGVRKFGKVFIGSATLYLNDYKNLLGADLAAAGGIGSGDLFNAGTAETKGLELQLGYDILKTNQDLSLPINISYTYTDAIFTSNFEADFDEWGEVLANFEMPYLARHQLNLIASIKANRFQFNSSTRYQSDVRTSPGTGDIPQGEKIDGFLVSDLSCNVFLNEWTTFNMSITNLFNKEYEVARRPLGLRPGMPRAFRVGVNVNL